MTREKKTWVCNSKKCDHTVVTYVPLSEPPTHTHQNTKRTYTMKEIKS